MKDGEERFLGQIRSANLDGYFMPFQLHEQPWLIQMPGNPSFWVPVYSSIEKLEESCAELGIKSFKVKQITGSRDFVKSLVEQNIRVMLDPYAVRSENKTRWTEIVPGE